MTTEAPADDRSGTLSAEGVPSPALRLISARGRLIRSRPVVLVASLAARLHLLRGFAIWPSPEAPMLCVDPGMPRTAAWMRHAFETRRDARAPSGLAAVLRARLDPASWSALRARAFGPGPPPNWILELAGRVLDRDSDRCSLALFSPTGAPQSKAVCFLFEAEAEEPACLLLAMADPSQSVRLEAEFDLIAELRGALAGEPETGRALPLEPIFRGWVHGEYVAIVPPDPLMSATGRENRTVALDWLLRLHTATASAPRAWGDREDAELLGELEAAWTVLRPDTGSAVRRVVAQRLRALHARPVSRSAVHGDFWHGNVATADGELRVWDWEWASLDGLPFLDLWSYELGILLRPPAEAPPPGGIAGATARVTTELERRDIDPRFASATLLPSLAQLAIRIRRTTGRPGPAEDALKELMAEAERLALEA